ncbi:MAG TPA: glycoside hydrolase family 43 protein [Burkholderiales bacterium]|nr:glycoside hydrolase family 43 protein [Burkholderiales bacterium]
MLRASLAAASALALASCATQGPPAFVNPVLPADFPDPAVLRAADGAFYAYATQTERAGKWINIQVARSADLVHWEELGDALPAKPAWAAAKQQFWAPHVLYDAERRTYFMYYSAEPDGATGKCLAVASAAAPSGPFVDSGRPLLCGEGIENIDPMAFDDPRSGKRLLYWGSGGAPLRVQELAADRLGFLPGSAARELLFPDAAKPYRALIEAPWVVYREPDYFLFYSGDRCCAREPRYAVMVARSGDAEGPFEDRSDPILEAGGGWIAPGHCSVIADDAGGDWILYHAYRAPGGAREMLLDRLRWDRGWPALSR